MKLEEILVKCDKCVQENERQKQQSVNQDDESGKVPNESGSSSEELLNEEDSQLEASSARPAIVKCVECDLHFCANCILDHQIQNDSVNHKLITVLPGLGELNESSAKNASAFMILNSTRGLDEALQAHQSSDSSPIIEKKRDCHASEFLNEGFLKVTDESYQEGLIKRRDSNIDKSSIENKMTPPATANHTASKLDEEDGSKEDLSGVIAEQPLHQHQLGDKESKVDTGSIVDFLNEFNGDKLKLHGVEQAFQQHQLPTNQLIQQQLLLKLKQQESRYQFQSSGQQAVGSNNRLTQIEAEINKTFSFYVQVLKERKEYLVKELNTIVQFAVLNHSQNINKQVQVQYQLELKKQQLEKELNDCYDMLNEQANGGASTGSNANVSIDEASVKNKLNLLNELNNLISMNNQLIAQLKSTNPLSSIEFISNYSAIQTSIRNTFGLIRINQQGSSNSVSVSSSSTSINQGYVPGGNKSHGFNHHASGPLNVICDKTLTSSSQHSLLSGQSSSGVSATASSTSLFPSNSSTSMGSSASAASELITSPVSTINKKHASTSSLPSFAAHEQWKSNHIGDYMLAGNELMMDQVVNGDDELLKLKSSYAEQMSAFDQGNAIRENPMITLSAGSTSSSKSNKSSSSSSSCKFSPTTASQGSSNYAYESGNLFLPQQHQAQNSGVAQHGSSSTSSFGGHHHHYKPHLMPNGGAHQFSHHGSHHNPFGRLYSLYDLTLKNSLQLTRSKMIYHCKFGEFGINDGQFTEPSGVTINTNNDIIVADTNSHRIQIFDREGNFKFKFGECGKRDGQLLYPNRVSIVKQTGDIVVTERSPTHQIQIYNKYGQFLRKFGANILQHPRGVFVDHKGRIVVVECKVMRVIIFDLFGNVLNKFNCSKYLEFPNGVCCSNPNASNNYREEIYISDNRAHCIKVFDYNGNFLRQIGGEGITNYPIGVGINSNNEILVADNHNNFNLTVFTQDGKLINALESKVKHAQCFDVGLMDDGSIVLASKDYRIYVYKYSTSEGMSSPIVASPTNPISASSSTMNANSSTLFPSSSSMAAGHQVNKYELFSDCNNNNSTPGSGIQHSPGGLYNYFKPNVSDGLTNNIAGLFSELSAHASSGNSAAAFHTASHLESNFFADSAALSAAAASNNNDMSHNESTSLLNLSTNTTTTNNLVSILNGIL